MPNASDQWLVTVASRLGALREDMVFVGGAILGLLIDDPGMAPIRPTDDLDAVVDVESRGHYYAIADQLRKLGFKHDTSEGAPLCRWLVDGVVVDIMPTDETILGFTNRWYRDAITTAIKQEIAPGIDIRVATAPYFVAMKLEAFAGRGAGDYVASHDLEDIIAIVDGREDLEDAIEASAETLRDYLAERIGALLDDQRFVDALAGHLPGDDASQARAPAVLSRLRRIARR